MKLDNNEYQELIIHRFFGISFSKRFFWFIISTKLVQIERINKLLHQRITDYIEAM